MSSLKPFSVSRSNMVQERQSMLHKHGTKRNAAILASRASEALREKCKVLPYRQTRRSIIGKPGVALLNGVNLLAQPISPRVHAIALCCSDGENGRLRIKILNCLVKSFPVEIEEGHRINFVQNNHP